jgi:hypothetical protein
MNDMRLWPSWPIFASVLRAELSSTPASCERDGGSWGALACWLVLAF